ncbi:hypothetical protein D3C77_458450 [compost metagenome]
MNNTALPTQSRAVPSPLKAVTAPRLLIPSRVMAYRTMANGPSMLASMMEMPPPAANNIARPAAVLKMAAVNAGLALTHSLTLTATPPMPLMSSLS